SQVRGGVSPGAHRPSPPRNSEPSPRSSASAHRRWLLRAHDDILAATPFRNGRSLAGHLVTPVGWVRHAASVRSAAARVADEVGRALHRFALELGVAVAFWRKCDSLVPASATTGGARVRFLLSARRIRRRLSDDKGDAFDGLT